MQNKIKTVVVIDTHAQDGLGNKIFDRDTAIKISHTLLPLCLLYEELKNRNIECISIEYFFENPTCYKNDEVLLISFLTSKYTKRITEYTFVKPILLICLESPYIATKFYLNINKISKKFKYVMLFEGMRPKIRKSVSFITTYFPISKEDSKESSEILGFKARKNIVLIAGNKTINNTLKKLLINAYYGFNIKNLYNTRKETVNCLAENNLIDIFGKGWNTELSPSIRNAYKGELSGGKKAETMRQYKFALCYENAKFPGYITEKIFDSFISSTVPVYLGASDINKYIPDNTFIDASKFKNDKKLIEYLSSINENDYNEYIRRINIFLNSDSFSKFKDVSFVNKILEIINLHQHE